MAPPKQSAVKQPADPYARRLKALTSAVQRLRGWTGSDPSRRPELVDALIELNGHRLLGHLYLAAAGDAQDTVRAAVEGMLSTGPVGPYTRVEDATRCGTAMIQLAAVQVGMGLPEAAGRTVESWSRLREQIAAVDLSADFAPAVVVWLLASQSRSALAAGAVADANAYADAALARLADSGLRDDPDVASYGLLAVDVDRLGSDCRWAAGQAAAALGFSHRGKDRYDAVTAGRLAQPGRHPPALIERLAEPLFGICRDLADRLAAGGDVDLALVTRRELIEALRGLMGRLGSETRVQLVAALTDLAEDLVGVERYEEARQAADEAVSLAEDQACAGTPRLLASAARARVLSRIGLGRGMVEDVVESLTRTIADEGEASVAASAVALGALAEVARGGGDVEAAEAIAAQAAELLPGRTSAQLRDLARGVIALGASEVAWTALSEEAGYGPAAPAAAEATSWLEAQRAEAHRVEQERLERARQEAESRQQAEAEAARVAAEQQALRRAEEQERARRDAEQRAAAEEAEQREIKRRREERLAEHQREVAAREAERRAVRRREIDERTAVLREVGPGAAEDRELERLRIELAELDGVPVVPLVREDAVEEAEPEPEPEAPDEVEVARDVWQRARAAGDRRGARASLDRLAEVLRPRAESDPAVWGPQLRDRAGGSGQRPAARRRPVRVAFRGSGGEGARPLPGALRSAAQLRRNPDTRVLAEKQRRQKSSARHRR